MKSKITIEIDYDNQPIIRINYEPSEDVRDFLVKRFLDTFEGESEYASFRFVETPQNFIGAKARLRPIKPMDLGEAAQVMDESYKKHLAWLQEVHGKTWRPEPQEPYIDNSVSKANS